MDELLSSLQSATVFSTISLAIAYHQVPLHEGSRGLTAFITHEGLFRSCHIPYGLASAPSAFQKMMATTLKGLSGVQNYLENIIVYGATQAKHNAHLHDVLHHLKDAGLLLNNEKVLLQRAQLMLSRSCGVS
ncbi:hypothetical protein LDENG_00162440 [Lucifuga dentata]|nr:hypothetical protein LDENG_00162440 [Lucifuga dentata]